MLQEFWGIFSSGSSAMKAPKTKRKLPVLEEWELVGGVGPVTIPLMDEFIRESIGRWAIGVKEYRMGDEDLPFKGDPLIEGAKECNDLYCYSKEMFSQGLVTETEHDMLNCFAYDAWKLIRKIQLEGRVVEPKEILVGEQED